MTTIISQKTQRTDVLFIFSTINLGDILFVLYEGKRYPISVNNGQIRPISEKELAACATTSSAIKNWNGPLEFLGRGQEDVKAEIYHVISESAYMKSKKAKDERQRKRANPTNAEQQEAKRIVLSHLHRLVEIHHRYADAFALAETYGIDYLEVRKMMIESVTEGVEFNSARTTKATK